MKVHRGQETVPPGTGGFGSTLAFGWLMCCATAGDAREFGKDGSRLVRAPIAALRMVVSGGLIPHARQGGKSVAALAVAGSKLVGTGLENEQMGQIQVALIGFGDGKLGGKFVCGRCESECVG